MDPGEEFRDVGATSRRVTGRGSFFIPVPPDRAFGLFTADGEREWVPGWDPVILGALPQASGLVFLTGAADCPTIWTAIRSDRATLSHQYGRVTPGMHAGTVEVLITPEAGGCRVHVRYDMTALPGSPPDGLHLYRGERFADMLADWARMIGSISLTDHRPETISP